MDDAQNLPKHGLEFSKSNLANGVTESDVREVMNRVLDDCQGYLTSHVGTKLSEYERQLTKNLYEKLNEDPKTKCKDGKQVWGVFVGNNFCSMWLPPKDSIRIHAKTHRVSIYLFRF